MTENDIPSIITKNLKDKRWMTFMMSQCDPLTKHHSTNISLDLEISLGRQRSRRKSPNMERVGGTPMTWTTMKKKMDRLMINS